MESVLPDLTLETVAHGAAPELFAQEVQKVLANIADPNTSAEAKRSVTITVTFAPKSERDGATVAIDCKSKLAPKAGEKGTVFIGRKRDGSFQASVYDPKQMQLNLDNETTGPRGTRESDDGASRTGTEDA